MADLTQFRNLRVGAQRPAAAPDRPEQPGLPAPPAWLDEEAKAEWRRVVALVPVWRPAYADALALYVVTWSDYRRDPARFNAAKLSQLRQLQAALKLTPDTAG